MNVDATSQCLKCLVGVGLRSIKI